MKVYNNLSEFKPLANAVVTIGTFDGVHFGHQKILNTLTECAKKTNGETVLLTFFPHPRMILHPEDESLRLINDIHEKVELLAHAGIDHLIITPFTRDFSNQSPEEYIRDVLVNKLGTKTIVVGFDHQFGKDRKGTMKELLKYAKTYNFEVKQIPEQDINEVAVSSTKIRESLIKGDIASTNLCLGYPFQMIGKVIRGNQLGRKIGFPTANLQLQEPRKLVPAYGIYAIRARLLDLPEIGSGTYLPHEPAKENHYGLGYIGNRPTVDGSSRSIEVNLFDFDQDLYDKILAVEFLHFIRYDERFDHLEDMITQMHKDKNKAKELLGLDEY